MHKATQNVEIALV